MARIAGGGAPRNRRQAIPSANEYFAALGQPFGLGPKQTRGMMNIMSQEGAFQSPFAGMPTAASSGEFFETISLLNATETMRYYNPQTQAEANKRNQAGEAVFYGEDVYYIDSQGNFVDRSSGRTYYDEDLDTGETVIPGEKGPQFGESDAPAPLSLVPTSSINPERPRTVAAGYDRDRSVLTVVFRDGTYYNYYEVTVAEWQDFKRRVSKGRYIYQVLDYKPRGPANISALPSYARAAFYRLTRTMQLKRDAKQYDRNAKKQRALKPKKR
jgi:KTSC domain